MIEEPIKERIYTLDAFFISLRTHFNFFRRLMTYLISFSALFTKFFLAFFQSIPFLNTILNFAAHTLDSLSFGTNTNNSPLEKTIAFVGYGSLITLGIISLALPTLFSPALTPALSLILGMYFEGVTILAWFTNYKTLADEQTSGIDVEPRRLDNARMMFYAAIITFTSMLLKAFSLSLAATFPAAALGIFIIAQLAEIGAVLGSIGKETVNFSQNYHFWTKTTPADIETESLNSNLAAAPSQEVEPDSSKFLIEALFTDNPQNEFQKKRSSLDNSPKKQEYDFKWFNFISVEKENKSSAPSLIPHGNSNVSITALI